MWILMIAIGVLVGWNLPQPEFAKTAQANLVSWAKLKWNTWVK